MPVQDEVSAQNKLPVQPETDAHNKIANQAAPMCRDYQRVEQALRYLAENYRSQPDLSLIATSVNLSEAHFQRLFKRWAGVSPKQFLQYLTLNHARNCLQKKMTVLDTALDSGLSAPARLNELFVRLEAITPAEYKHKGEGIVIDYGFHQTAFGDCLLGVTDRGLTSLTFCTDSDRKLQLAKMQKRLSSASYQCNPQATEPFLERIFGASDRVAGNREASDRKAGKRGRGGANQQVSKPQSLSLLVSGTPFQIKVWEALLRVPAGARISYGQLARSIDNPKAVRAVGTAVGYNPVAVLIPCHRVIREDGMLGGYHWGVGRKLALLGVESVFRQNVKSSLHDSGHSPL